MFKKTISMSTQVAVPAVLETRRIRRLLEQLQDLGWSKVQSLDRDFHQLVMIYRDENTEKVWMA